jgi:hypothetical protein
VKLLGASTRPGDKFENFELVVNGKQGTYLNDDGLFVNRDDAGQRLNGRSAEHDAALNAQHDAAHAQQAADTKARLQGIKDKLNSRGSDSSMGGNTFGSGDGSSWGGDSI